MTGKMRPLTAPARRPRSRGGFSLIELMFALTIIAIALMGIFSVILHTSRTKEAMRETEVAKEAAAVKMEEVKSYTTDEIKTRYASGASAASFTVSALTNATTSNPTQKGAGTVTIYSATDAELIDITIAVQWKGIKGLQTYTLRGMVTK